MRGALCAASLLIACLLLVAAGSPSRAEEESKGKLEYLIARREITDPFFERSVVLMLPSKGLPLVVGLIINKPTRITLLKLYPDGLAPRNHTAVAYFGGPVDVQTPGLLFRAPKPLPHAVPVFGDAYLTFDPDSISTFLNDPKQTGDFRLFLGRAQWGPEQLQREILEKSWYRLEAGGDLIFDPDSEHQWRRLHDRAKPALNVRNLLAEPSGN